MFYWWEYIVPELLTKVTQLISASVGIRTHTTQIFKTVIFNIILYCLHYLDMHIVSCTDLCLFREKIKQNEKSLHSNNFISHADRQVAPFFNLCDLNCSSPKLILWNLR